MKSETKKRLHDIRIAAESIILSELPKLSRDERRQIAAAIFELEEDAEGLRECDILAEERFLMLDKLEEQNAQTKSS